MQQLKTTPNDTVIVTLSFTDLSGNPMIPTTLSYSVVDQTSGTVIIPSTPVAPTGTSQVITVSKANNALVARLQEVHALTAVATDVFGNSKGYTICWEVQDPSLACGNCGC